MAKPLTDAPELLCKILGQASLESAAIIDDAFDPIRGDDLGSGVNDFWDHCIRANKSSKFGAELAEFCKRRSEEIGREFVITSRDDLTDEVIGSIRSVLHLFPELRETASKTLFSLYLDKLEPILDLQARLEELHVTVRQFGAEFKLGDFRPKIIFLDYFLGVTDDEAAVATARARIQEIYELYGVESEKPFVVLMSSEDVGSKQRAFCNDAKILYGLLTFAPKQDLRTKERLYYHLASWSLDLPSRHVVQLFVEALEASLASAQLEFSKHLRSLGLDDYANLQWLSLQSEGHPLGDYMLWLLKEMLSHLLHNSSRVLQSQMALDTLQVGRFLPSAFPPSFDLAKLYKMALTEPGFKPADRHPAGNGQGDDFYLKLGDMFFNDAESSVVMALSAACDLAYSATSPARKFPKDRFILFAFGQMEPVDAVPSHGSMRTEPYLHDDGRVYRINWRHRNATWTPYGNARAWLSEKGFIHKAQMSLPYALEIQKSYANSISRIGLPIHPPTCQWPEVALCCEGSDGKWRELIRVPRGIQLVNRRLGESTNETLFVISRECIFHMPEALASADAILAEIERSLYAAKATVAKDVSLKEDVKQKKLDRILGKLSKVAQKRAKIAEIDSSAEACLPLILTPQVLDWSEPHVVLGDDLPWMYLNVDYNNDFQADSPLAFNVKTGDNA